MGYNVYTMRVPAVQIGLMAHGATTDICVIGVEAIVGTTRGISEIW